MAERIVKGELSRLGEAVEVQARRRHVDADAENAEVDESAIEAASSTEKEHQAKLSEAASEAKRLVAEATAQSAQILAEAGSEVDRLKSDWQQQHEQQRQQFEQEMQARRDQLEKEIRAQIEATYRERYEAAARMLESLAAQTRDRQLEFLQSVEDSAFELVLEIAKNVIRRDMRDSRQAITNLIISAFGILKPDKILTVHVNPGIFHLLLEDELFKRGLGEAGIKLDSIDLEIDENLDPNQFVAEVATGRLAFNLEEVLEEMADKLAARKESAAELADGGEDE